MPQTKSAAIDPVINELPLVLIDDQLTLLEALQQLLAAESDVAITLNNGTASGLLSISDTLNLLQRDPNRLQSPLNQLTFATLDQLTETTDINLIAAAIRASDNGYLLLLDQDSSPSRLLHTTHVKNDEDATATQQLQNSDFQQLQILKQRLDEAQRVASIGSWELNTVTGELWWSDETYRIFELAPSKFGASYEAFLNTIHPEDREKVNRAYTQSLDNQTPYQISHRLLMPDGRIKYVSERCESFFDPSGDPIRSIGTVQDITEKTLRERDVARLHAMLSALVKESSDAIFIKDLDKRYKVGNEALARLLGQRAENLINKDDFDLFPTEVATRFRDDDDRIMEAGKTETFEEDVIVSGESIPFQTTKGPLLINGEVQGVFGIARDISQLKQNQEALKASESLYRELYANMSDGVAIFTLDNDSSTIRYKELNNAGRKIDGLMDHTVCGKALSDVPANSRTPSLVRAMLRVLESGDAEHHPVRILQQHSLKLWVEHYLFKLPSGELVDVFSDRTEQKRAEEQQRLAAGVFENTAEGVMITDPTGAIIDVNSAFCSISGYERDEVIGKNPRILQSGRHDESFYHNLWLTLERTGYWQGEIWNRRKDGTIFPELQTISSVYDEQGNRTHYISVFTDISQFKQSQEMMKFLAHHDALTGLPNRLLLMERISQAVKHSDRSGRMFALIYLDIDNFKSVNDSLGHKIGDQLLKNVSDCLNQTVRHQDTVARLSSDEFVLLLEDVDTPGHAATVADKLQQNCDTPMNIDGHEVYITASMGISVYPKDGKEPAEMLRNADAALHRAKEDGRNTYRFYTEEMTRNAFERILLKNALHHAIARDQLFLTYQPQIDLSQQKLIGVEALIRWQHPDLGTVSPANFIPMAEETGQILAIGEWVLQEACTQARRWMDQGLEVGTISVNVAGPQLQRGELPELVSNILQQSRLPANKLELEVTEGFIMQRAEHSIEQLQQLRAMGVSLAIDDFGTGYSSLAYLKKLPINKLKIDRSFIKDIPADENDKAISSAVIALGLSLGLKVIAEGIENNQQSDFLQQAGCHQGQGYKYSRPLKAAEFEKWLTTFNHSPATL